MTKEKKQMLLQQGKVLINKLTANLNSEISKIEINSNGEDFENLFLLNKEIDKRLEQMKTSIFNK